MTSATETAVTAFVAALVAAAAAPDPKIPPPERNQDLVSRLVEIDDGSTLEHYLNVLDGDRQQADELLGADLGAESFDLTHHIRVEFATVGGTSAAREAAFDASRVAIWDAVKPNVSGGSITYLGGAVDSITLVDFIPHTETAAFGLPNVKAAELVFALTFTSSRPF